MFPLTDFRTRITRRHFFGRSGTALGTATLASLLAREASAAPSATPTRSHVASGPHLVPKAKRVVYLFQSGGPSHLEMLDYKPELKRLHGSELPDSVRQGQRLTGMTSGQKNFPAEVNIPRYLVKTFYRFNKSKSAIKKFIFKHHEHH